MANPKAVPCPTCKRVVPWEDNRYRPFCSERCRLTDLGNWAVERYRIPGPPVDVEPPPEGDDSED